MYLEKGRKCQYPYSLTHHQKCNSWNLTQFLYSFNTTQLQKVQPFKGSKGEKGGQRCKPLSRGHTGSRKMSRDPKPPGVWGHLGLYSFWSQLQHSSFLFRLFKMRKSPCKTAPSRKKSSVWNCLCLGDGSIGKGLVPQTHALEFEFPNFYKSQIH